MICRKCGTPVTEGAELCTRCADTGPAEQQGQSPANNSLIGFSSKINDPMFAAYIKNSNRWSLLFASILAASAIIGFYIYGENSADMDNPQALYIGLGIGGMFICIALYQIIARGRSTTWDGIVVDKKVEKKRRRRDAGNNDYYWDDYTEYTVVIRSEWGKTKVLCAEDDDTAYIYYQIGDRVRHHKGLNSFEKYDKSRDSIIFCSACSTLNDINSDHCHRCHCPLLK